MRNLLLAGAALALFVGGTAMAAEATLTIEPSHRHLIKQFIIKEHVKPIQVRETVAVGTVLPAEVTLQPVPQTLYADVPEVQNYEYFDWNGKVVLVDPQTRQVVDIVE